MNTFWIVYLIGCIGCIIYLCVHRKNNNQQTNGDDVVDGQQEPAVRDKDDLQYALDVVNT